MSSEITQAWTRADLDKLTCQVPGCSASHGHGPLFLHAVCHPKKPQNVQYHHGGVIALSCTICGKHTLNIQIAAEHQVELDEAALDCGDPACKEPPDEHSMRLRPPCHQKAGAWVTYTDGHLFLVCGKCKRPVGGVLHVKPASAEA